MENRGHGRGQGRKRNEADESFAAARCEFARPRRRRLFRCMLLPQLTYDPPRAAAVYRPHHTVQSDAEALEDAKREVQGLPPLNRGQQRERNETATDDQVYERFKKRCVGWFSAVGCVQGGAG